MYKFRYLLSVLVLGVALNGCTTTAEPQPAAATPPEAVPAAATTEPTPLATPVAETSPAPAPTAAVAVAPSRKVVTAKPKPVAAPVAAATPAAPAPTSSGPREAELAAAQAAVDEALKRMVLEQARFTAPATMQAGASGDASLSFENGAALDAVRSALAADPRLAKVNLQVSGRVEALLTGNGIEVKANSALVQEVTPGSPGKWQRTCGT